MSEVAQHPDLFTDVEAIEYLHLAERSDAAAMEAAKRTLETFRERHKLKGQLMGRRLMYHRHELDDLVTRLFNVSSPGRRR